MPDVFSCCVGIAPRECRRAHPVQSCTARQPLKAQSRASSRVADHALVSCLEMYVLKFESVRVECSEVRLGDMPAAFCCTVSTLTWESVELASHVSCPCLGRIDVRTEGRAWYFDQMGLRDDRKNQ